MRPPELPPLRPVAAPVRIYASPGAHRAIPVSLAAGLVQVRTEVFWRRSAGARGHARLAMRYLLGCSPRASEAVQLGACDLICEGVGSVM